MVTDENKPTRCRGRAWGLIAVWEEERREKLQINNYSQGLSGGKQAPIHREGNHQKDSQFYSPNVWVGVAV